MSTHLQNLIGRRRAMSLGFGTIIGIGAFTLISQSKNAQSPIQEQALRRNFTVAGEASLRVRAARKGLLYGSVVLRSKLANDPEFAASITKECSIVVPEGELKWDMLRANPEGFNFAPADWLVEFTHKRNMLMRGHTLVWHEALPSWVESVMNSVNAKQILTDHITTVVKRYAGKIHSWDVVNEAIQLRDGRPDGLRNTPWLLMLGPDYIEMAFRTAAKADPKAMLVYNDFGLDYDAPSDNAKRAAVLRLLERLKSKSVPVHALGIQAHLLRGKNPRFNPEKFKAFLQDVASLGLKILITELDVTDKTLPKEIQFRDRIVAAAYEDYLSVALSEPAVIAVLTWGLSDRYTWLSKHDPRQDGTSVRPLPLDKNLKRKLAWKAIARSFDKAPRRSAIVR
jgi:endo-1,4-beta-xylanase